MTTLKQAAAALKKNLYHDFADGEAEAIVKSLNTLGFAIVKVIKPTKEQIDGLARIIDPDSFVNAMLEDDLTPTERVIFSDKRERDKEIARRKAREILGLLSNASSQMQ